MWLNSYSTHVLRPTCMEKSGVCRYPIDFESYKLSPHTYTQQSALKVGSIGILVLSEIGKDWIRVTLYGARISAFFFIRKIKNMTCLMLTKFEMIDISCHPFS